MAIQNVLYNDDPDNEDAEFNKKYDAYKEEKEIYKKAFIAEGMHPAEADEAADEMAYHLLLN